jgi:hypothetical protein
MLSSTIHNAKCYGLDIVGSVAQILGTAALTIVTFGAAAPSTVSAFVSAIYLISKSAYTAVHLSDLLRVRPLFTDTINSCSKLLYF